MSQLDVSALFEYLFNGFTAIVNIDFFSVREPFLFCNNGKQAMLSF